MLHLLAFVLTSAIGLVIFLIFAQVLVYWLVAFDVLKVRTPQARNLVDTLNTFAEKLYRPLRPYIPPIGGIDLTPIVVILGLQLLSSLIVQILR